jgi:hypothetical protein
VVLPADLFVPALEQPEAGPESVVEVGTEQVESAAFAVSAHTPEPPASYPQE